MESLILHKKSKKGQLVFNLIAGVSALIILAIVCFLIVDTLNGADLLSQSASSSVVNETLTSVDDIGENLAYSTLSGALCSVSYCINSTDSVTVPAANWTATNCKVAYSGPAGAMNNTDWKCTYSYTWDGLSQNSVNGIIANYTEGINNVSEKIPTVLLVAAVVLLFGAIVFLVQRARQTTDSTGGSL